MFILSPYSNAYRRESKNDVRKYLCHRDFSFDRVVPCCCRDPISYVQSCNGNSTDPQSRQKGRAKRDHGVGNIVGRHLGFFGLGFKGSSKYAALNVFFVVYYHSKKVGKFVWTMFLFHISKIQELSITDQAHSRFVHRPLGNCRGYFYTSFWLSRRRAFNGSSKSATLNACVLVYSRWR